MTSHSPEKNLPQYQTKVVPDTPVAEAKDAVPEAHDVDHFGNQAGIEPPNNEPLAVKSQLDKRDEQRWQLNPDSAEDH